MKKPSWDRLSQTETRSSFYRKAEREGRNIPNVVPSSKKTTNAFFERMNKTDTFATASASIKPGILPNIVEKKKAPEIKTTNAFFDRMSKTETYATSTMKGKISLRKKNSVHPNKSRSTTNTKGKPSHNQKTTNSFFNRMSKTETYATADMKGKISFQPTITSNGKRTTNNAFFNRMSKTETYATADMKGKISGKIPPQPKFTTYHDLKKDALSDRKSKIEIYTTSDVKVKPIPNDENPIYENSTDNKRATNAFFNRMSKTETYATSDMKGKISTRPKSPKSPTNSKRTTNAFFNRMSKTETYATSDMKGKILSTPNSIYENPAHNKLTTNAFFERMSNTETYATSTLKGPVSTFYNPKTIYG